jgi:predicted Zn-dependent protease
MILRRALSTSATALLATHLAGCALNPATGRRELSLVGQDQEIQMGRDAAQDVATSIGVLDAPALTAYITGVGKDLAANSERPNLPWSFRVVDDPAVNAFALPGGFIYVTRGILADLQSEAELAGVLGHEIGHVTARHSVSQISRQQLQQIGLGVGMVLSADVRKYGDVLQAGLTVLNLKYSRGDETQADELGVRYLTRTGYDAAAMVGVFQMLEALPSGGGRVPEWQLTHPYPENREAHIRQVIAAQGSAAGTGRRDGRDAYLDHVNGLVYGVNPREGYFDGSRYYHPDLAFQLRFPDGWKGQNSPAAVTAVSPNQEAAVILEPLDTASDPGAALRAFLAGDGVEGGVVRQSDADGIPRARALFSARTSDAEVLGEVSFLRYRGTVYRLMGLASADKWASYAEAVSSTLSSFAPVTDRTVLDVQPLHLEVVTVPGEMTLAGFQQRYPSAVPLDEVARINRLAPSATVAAGTRLKRVVGKALP